MWQEIKTEMELQTFMEKLHFFHDSCIKEIQYISGAYVNAELRMHAINDRRLLRVLVQRQCAELATLELEFGGLKYMNLIPLDETSQMKHTPAKYWPLRCIFKTGTSIGVTRPQTIRRTQDLLRVF